MSVISSATFAVAEPLGATLSVEGGLIGPDQVARIVAGRAKAQTAADYGFPRQIELRRKAEDAYRDAKAVWSDRTRDVAVTIRDILHHAFGFDDIVATQVVEAGDAVYPIPMVAGGRVPIVVAQLTDEHRSPLDRARHEGGDHGRYRSPALLLQDCLNASDAMMWGIVSDGRRFRLMRDSVRLGRPAFLEADLATILETDDLSSFTGLWLLMHRSRFGRDGTAADCALESWMEEAAATGIAVRERLRDGVEAALKALGAGILADAAVRAKVVSGEIAVEDLFAELLRAVYRIIFLLTAEDRGLLHPPGANEAARTHYEGGYAMRRAAERARRRAAWDRHRDAYEAAKIVFHALAHGQPMLALPALGGLFSTGHTPILDAAAIGNAHWYEALFRIAWIADSRTGALYRVNWRDMQTEELGSVYESLLELVPRLADGGTALAFGEGAEAKGNARKTTGSYYTPDSLVQALLDTALDPVLDGRRRDGPDAILSMTIIDPACGSGHFLLAAARRLAEALARERARLGGESFTPQSYRHALREVVARCIHGVDRNEFAVELTKVALWIETVDPGKPLGFLGANILCGDSLLGLFDLAALEKGIPDAAYAPLTGDDKTVAKTWGKLNAAEKKRDLANIAGVDQLRAAVTRHAASVRAMPEDTLEDVEMKHAAYASRDAVAERHRLRVAADVYLAAFVLPKHEAQVKGRPTMPTTRSLPEALRNTLYGLLEGACVDAAMHARAFHWPLEFATVMAAGGFDVVVGNPPWERVKLQEKEFFGSRRPEIAEAANAAARGRLIAALADADEGTPDRMLHEEFKTAKREAEAASVFARIGEAEGGRFPLTGRGDVNTYALFAELFASLAGPSGRAGIIVPTGIATDATTAPFFAALVENRRLARLTDFENRAALFPAVDSRLKFCLLTLGRDVKAAEFGFFLTDPAQWLDLRRRLSLSPANIASFNPNTKTVPVFRSRYDLALSSKMYERVDLFCAVQEDRWKPSFFKKMFDFDIHKALLTFSESAPTPAHLPVYEAKLIDVFNHRFATYEGVDAKRRKGGKARDATLAELTHSDWEISPRCWTTLEAFEKRMAGRSWNREWFLSMRDVTNATNERTALIAVRPRLPSNDKLPTIFLDVVDGRFPALLANLSSLSFDYCVRQKVGGTNFGAYIVEQIPVVPPSAYTAAALDYITPRVLELTYTSDAMAPFARDLGHEGPPFTWDEDRRARLRADLDGWFAHAYGLTRDELCYVLDPADVMGPDYPSETFRVLKTNEERRFGEYRTRRLVLAAFDDLATRRTETGLEAVDAALASRPAAAQ